MTDEQQASRTRAFAKACKRERDSMLKLYSTPGDTTAVSAHLHQARLTETQLGLVLLALDCALTDAFYSMLLALDGAVSLDGEQQSYVLLDLNGEIVSDGTGDLEAYAYEAFHSPS
jgi:hypothetical protein